MKSLMASIAAFITSGMGRVNVCFVNIPGVMEVHVISRLNNFAKIQHGTFTFKKECYHGLFLVEKGDLKVSNVGLPFLCSFQ
jgi:hypothetical protein